MSRWAKKANTTTMRIGKAADLKKRLIPGKASLLGVQRCHERQVAVSFCVIQPVSDDESVRDLEADVLGVDLRLAAFGLGQERAHLQCLRLARRQVAQQLL